jgi:sortase A
LQKRNIEQNEEYNQTNEHKEEHNQINEYKEDYNQTNKHKEEYKQTNEDKEDYNQINIHKENYDKINSQSRKSQKRNLKKARLGKKTVITISIVLIVTGLAVILYPTFSNWFNSRKMVSQISVYVENVNKMDKETINKEWQKAVDYNNSLMGNPVKDPFVPGSGVSLPENYTEVLDIGGIMGYIEIPKIEVNLPIFHGTSDEVLEKGVGHLEGSALPIGGKGTHSLLSGHTGLPEAKLFTDLTKLKYNDKFILKVLDQKLTYKVCRIDVVEPKDISKLSAEKGKDYVTLITCTPYGINSHRLLVRGERIYQLNNILQIRKKESNLIVLLLAVSTNCMLIWMACYIKNKAKQKK